MGLSIIWFGVALRHKKAGALCVRQLPDQLLLKDICLCLKPRSPMLMLPSVLKVPLNHFLLAVRLLPFEAPWPYLVLFSKPCSLLYNNCSIILYYHDGIVYRYRSEIFTYDLAKRWESTKVNLVFCKQNMDSLNSANSGKLIDH